MRSSRWWLGFYIFILVQFFQSTLDFGHAPHTVYRVIAAVMSVIGIVFASVKTRVLIRSLE